MPVSEVVLARDPVVDVNDYVNRGGGVGYQMARALATDGVLAELQHAGLRGRGGAGFPTWRKWQSVLSAAGQTKYVVANGAEGEPGTFKDRAIMRANPYQVVEGLAIAALVMGCDEVFIAVKASFERERVALLRAAHELLDADLIGDLAINVVCGPEEYLFGEEKALLEVIEGRDPQPRQLPPYLHGLYATVPQLGWHSHEPELGHARGDESNPTLVSNVETFANVTHIVARGADWYRTLGTADDHGTIVATVVGDVREPCVVEVELGTTMRELIELAGGVGPGHRVKAVFSGVTNPLLPGDLVDVALTHDAMARAGSGLGAAGFIVYDETACMVEVAAQFSRFLWVESCGQCTACKLGMRPHHQRARPAPAGRCLRVGCAADPAGARGGGRRQPLLPPRRGTAGHRERTPLLPRGLRRPPRTRMPDAARARVPQDHRSRTRHRHLRHPPGRQAARLDLRGLITRAGRGVRAREGAARRYPTC